MILGFTKIHTEGVRLCAGTMLLFGCPVSANRDIHSVGIEPTLWFRNTYSLWGSMLVGTLRTLLPKQYQLLRNCYRHGMKSSSPRSVDKPTTELVWLDYLGF